jgi:hypothetical protein
MIGYMHVPPVICICIYIDAQRRTRTCRLAADLDIEEGLGRDLLQVRRWSSLRLNSTATMACQWRACIAAGPPAEAFDRAPYVRTWASARKVAAARASNRHAAAELCGAIALLLFLIPPRSSPANLSRCLSLFWLPTASRPRSFLIVYNKRRGAGAGAGWQVRQAE